MSWVSLRFTAAATTAEALSDALGGLGALSISLDDAAVGTAEEQAIFGEPGMAEEALWNTCAIAALFPADIDPRAIADLAAGAAGLSDTPPFTVTTVAEEDWVRLTQAQFEPMRVSARLWVVPSWHEAPDPRAINIKLDPGVAFGTGSHPTTRLCLQWLDEHLRGGETVVDYGCGSGILAIAAKKLGAGRVVGIDIDAQAVEAARFNAAQNSIVAEFRLPAENAAFPAQITVANILANPLKLLAPLLAACTAAKCSVVLSGILAPQAAEVMANYDSWFDMAIYKEDSGWVCLHGRKRSP